MSDQTQPDGSAEESFTGEQFPVSDAFELLDVVHSSDHMATDPDTNREQLRQQNG